jgi:opacity protein-like surface antigen
MKNVVMTAALAALALSTGACSMQQSTAQQLNTTNANSRIYIGSLTCNVGGSTGYLLGSAKPLDCVFLGKDGVSTAQYTGTIDKVGIDIGYTKAVHTIWRVYSLGSDRGPTQIGGTYVGEQGTVAAGNQAGGNWIYGGPNAEIGMLASGVVKDAGYNLATGIAAMTIRLKQ